MGFFDKIDNVSGSNIIKKVFHRRSGKMFVTSASHCRAFNQNVLDCQWAMTSRTLRLISDRQGPSSKFQQTHPFNFTLNFTNITIVRTTK